MYVGAADASADKNLDLNPGRRHTRNRTKPLSLPSKPRKLPPSTYTPKTASEKAIFRRNASESPLLRLPSEIRNRIWVFVLGERMLHFRHKLDIAMRKGEVLLVTECACSLTERALFERYLALLERMVELEDVAEEEEKEEREEVVGLQPFDLGGHPQAFHLDFNTLENPDVLENFDFDSFLTQRGFLDEFGSGYKEPPPPSYYSVPPDFTSTLSPQLQKRHLLAVLRENPHQRCWAKYSGNSADQLQSQLGSFLGLLQVCRQVYGEAKAVFWSTNTFSFKRSYDLVYFMKARPLLVRNMVTKLHLVLDDVMLWGKQLYPAPEIKLKGLKELHLSITAARLASLKGCEIEILDWLGVSKGRGLKDVTILCGLSKYVTDAVSGGYRERIEIMKRIRAELMATGSIVL